MSGEENTKSIGALTADGSTTGIVSVGLGRAFEEEKAKRAGTSPTSKRRYRDYEWVALIAPIRCPKRNTSQADFDAKTFAFFVEDGMFCLEVIAECLQKGRIVEVPPAQIREARRPAEAT